MRSWPPARSDVVARVSVPQGTQPTGLYLAGERLVVLGAFIDPQGALHGTRALVYDVSDRARPELTRTVDIEGQLIASRRVGRELYVVTNTQLRMPEKLARAAQALAQQLQQPQGVGLRPWEQQDRLARWLRAELTASVSDADLEEALPRVRDRGRLARLACADLWLPRDVNQLGVVTLTRVSLVGEPSATVGVMGYGSQMVYASSRALYVTAQAWDQQAWPRRIVPRTRIHKFALRGPTGAPSYEGSGAVPGSPLNQFSLSEHADHLRVTTTSIDENGGGQTINNLFVLRASDRRLAIVGAITGLAKGERIFAARMFGDKGYIVTFRQTDPLYTVDLSDPTQPRVAGELKVNGFSNYIHPIGGDLLLTIGQDADDRGRVQGLHLQVFDVSDAERPRRRFHHRMNLAGYSWSPAQHDHHAFTYDPRTRTLAVPAQFQGGKNDFAGLLLFRVDPRHGIDELGRIGHDDLGERYRALVCAGGSPQLQAAYCQDGNRAAWRGIINRSIIIDDHVYSFSQFGLQVNALDEPAKAVASVPWLRSPG
jgi:hypothetical protein